MIQVEKEKHQNCSCFPQHTVHNLSLSASSNSLWPKTRGIICFTFLHLGFSLCIKLLVWNRRFIFTQPLWSNMIFLQHLTLTWQSYRSVWKSEFCSCGNTWESWGHLYWLYISPSWTCAKYSLKMDFNLKGQIVKAAKWL